MTATHSTRPIVASAERTYVDPSALRCLYLHDERSARFCKWRQRVRGALPLTRFGRAELVNSLCLAVNRQLIPADSAQAAVADLDTDIAEGRLNLVDALWRRALDMTAALSQLHTPRLATRTLDVLHVASAVVLEATHFVSYDVRQAALAKALGFKVLSP
jgi:predicted nucleic acid-binding protein